MLATLVHEVPAGDAWAYEMKWDGVRAFMLVDGSSADRRVRVTNRKGGDISAGYPGTKEWVQQVQSRFHLPMVSGCTAVSAPEYYPYLQSGQLRGLLGGMAGAAEYEKLRHETGGSATRGMDAQSLAHVFVAFCIVLGNVIQWNRRRRPAS